MLAVHQATQLIYISFISMGNNYWKLCILNFLKVLKYIYGHILWSCVPLQEKRATPGCECIVIPEMPRYVMTCSRSYNSMPLLKSYCWLAKQ